MYDDTITAIATPIGVAGVGVIRLSGPDSLDIARRCFIPVSANASWQPRPRYVHFGQFVDPSDKAVIDQVCFIYFKSPHSFTGEDVVEIQCHSSSYILKAITRCFVQRGARLANKGEFTKRAFVHGKCDLTQAESIIDLIHAQSHTQHQVSLNRVEGRLFQVIQAIRETFMRALEQIEGCIDFPDEVPPLDRQDLLAIVQKEQKTLQHILDLKDIGKSVISGVHCLLIGKPNVGKSSLFNALLGFDRSIVTDKAGTTRDYVTESVDYKGQLFHIYDTAGLRDSDDIIEYMGMKKVQDLIKRADLLLWVVDSSHPFSDQDQHVYDALSEHPNIILIQNKSDLVGDKGFVFNQRRLTELLCSVHDESSISLLKETIYKESVRDIEEKDLDLLCNIRQYSCIEKAKGYVEDLCRSIEEGKEEDMLVIDFRLAIECFSELTGDQLTEEMLDGVFSRFCVGK